MVKKYPLRGRKHLLKGQFKDHVFSEYEIGLIEDRLVCGMTLEEIAKIFYGIMPSTWHSNLNRLPNHAARARFKAAIENATTEAFKSVDELAKGAESITKEYSIPVTEIETDALRDAWKRIEVLAEDGKWKEILLIMSAFVIPDDKFLVKVSVKKAVPEFRAAELILKSLKPELFDAETKRKMIPSKHIIVTLQGDNLKQLKKAVKADYVIEA